MKTLLVLAVMSGLLSGPVTPAADEAAPSVDGTTLAAFVEKWKTYEPYKVPTEVSDRPLLLAALRMDPAGPWFAYILMQAATAYGVCISYPDRREATVAGMIPVLQEANGILDAAVLKNPEDTEMQDRQLALQPLFAKFLLASGTNYLNEVRAIAQRILDQNKDPGSWKYGNAIFDGNDLLGRVSLREGKAEAARGYLRAAGHSPGSPTLGSFGPEFVLARELLEHGDPADRETVIAFLDDIAGFWANPDKETEQVFRELKVKNRNDIGAWKETIRAGKIPEFPRSH
jgi:hypothetical protein